ncbi:MAG: bacteriohopanetetrol glucosamine biosynthesis glycosyltransferase HpnI [Janthinobacterium lividum]
MIDPASAVLASLTLAGVVQSAAGWLAVRRFSRQPAAAPVTRPPVTVLKPLHGDEPLLEDALASYCEQDYPAFQIVFGVQDAADPALRVLRRLRARFPGVDMAVVVDPTPHGANRKVANLINMLPEAKHDVLVIADSDIHAAPDYLDSLVRSLAVPDVGLVTTLYAGLPSGDSLTGRLGSSGINHAFLPGALLARAMGRQDCMGATMALRRDTLDRIGGLPALSDHLADDAVLGRLVRARGLDIALASTVPATTVPETRMPALFQHELRWARTIQSLVPVEFALSAVQFPLFWSALLVGLSGGDAWTWLVFASAWAVRGASASGVERQLGLAPGLPIWLLPLRDLFSVSVILASYWTDQVAWRGQTLRATRPGLVPHTSLSRSGLHPSLSPTKG